ncbi:MAG: hypothetical protein V4520_09665 [Bacteroidota bacterium]
MTDTEKNSVLTIFPDSLGKIKFLLPDTKLFSEVVISSLGYKSVKIPISKIKGKNATIIALLEVQNDIQQEYQWISDFKIKINADKKGYKLKTKYGKELLFKWFYKPAKE